MHGSRNGKFGSAVSSSSPLPPGGSGPPAPLGVYSGTETDGRDMNPRTSVFAVLACAMLAGCRTTEQVGDANTDDSGMDHSVEISDEDGPDSSVPVCGNGIVEEGEECDDDNSVRWDGCDECSICEFQVNTYIEREQSSPSAAISEDGNFIVVWKSMDQDGSEEGVYGRLFNASGYPSTGELQVNERTMYKQRTPSVAMDGDGYSNIVWIDQDESRNDSVAARRFSPSGVRIGPEIELFDNPGVPDVAMAADGRTVFVWVDATGDVFAAIYNADSIPVGAEFRVNVLTYGEGWGPRAAMDIGGNFVVTWGSIGDGDEHGIYCRLFDADGSARTDEFLVNTFTDHEQRNADVTMASDGRFTVVWQSDSQDGDGWGIFGQRFDEEGVRVAEEFQVNTWTRDSQQSPTISMAEHGNFIVAWESWHQDGSGTGVYGRLFDPSGEPDGPEFQINTHAERDQWHASVAMTYDGRFVVAWTSSRQDGDSHGVFAQRYDASGNPLGTLSW